MKRKPNAKTPDVIDGETGKPDTPPLADKLLGRDLATIRQARRAIAKVIRAEVNGELEHFRAKGIVWMLTALAGVIQDGELEQRIQELEDQAGKAGAIPGQRALPERTLN